jgi:hypothetical protein
MRLSAIDARRAFMSSFAGKSCTKFDGIGQNGLHILPVTCDAELAR